MPLQNLTSVQKSIIDQAERTGFAVIRTGKRYGQSFGIRTKKAADDLVKLGVLKLHQVLTNRGLGGDRTKTSPVTEYIYKLVRKEGENVNTISHLLQTLEDLLN